MANRVPEIAGQPKLFLSKEIDIAKGGQCGGSAGAAVAGPNSSGKMVVVAGHRRTRNPVGLPTI